MTLENKPILLILDLDETLIHATPSEVQWLPDFEVEAFKVKKRPHLEEFLVQTSQWYELAIWSSASDDYVEEMVKRIQPETVDFEFVWGRSRCTYSRDIDQDEFYWQKKLKKVKKRGYELERMLIVDDSKEKIRSNYGNAIYIRPFECDPDDDELLHLEKYLFSLRDCQNVRALEKRGWRN